MEIICKQFERPAVSIAAGHWTKLQDSASFYSEVYYRPRDESVYMLSMEDAGAKRYHMPTFIEKFRAKEPYKPEVHQPGKFAHLRVDVFGDAVWMLETDGTVWRNEKHRRLTADPKRCPSGLRLVKKKAIVLIHEDMEEKTVSAVVVLSASLSILSNFQFQQHVKNCSILPASGAAGNLSLLLLHVENGVVLQLFRGRKLHPAPLKLI